MDVSETMKQITKVMPAPRPQLQLDSSRWRGVVKPLWLQFFANPWVNQLTVLKGENKDKLTLSDVIFQSRLHNVSTEE